MKKSVKHISTARSIRISPASTSEIMSINTPKGRYAFLVVTDKGHILFSFRGYKTLNACAERYKEYQKMSDGIRSGIASPLEDSHLFYGVIARYDGKVYLIRPLHFSPTLPKLLNHLNKNKASLPGLEIDCLIDDNLDHKTARESTWLN